MNDLDRDSLSARLRAGDPHQGETMPALDAARIKARMRAGGKGAHVRSTWARAAAAAAIAGVVGLGVWVGSRPSVPEQPSPAASPRTPAGIGVAESPAESVATPELPLARSPAPTDLTAVRPAPALPDLAEAGPGLATPTETAVAAHELSRTETPRTEPRRIQFTAPRGTRIVWTLDPDFEPSTTRNDAPTARHQQGANSQW